jgi:hypothetical protein
MDDIQQKIDQSLDEKLDNLAEEKFSDEASYKFFGNLNHGEIARLIYLFTNDKISYVDSETKELVLKYLGNLDLKIREKQKIA